MFGSSSNFCESVCKELANIYLYIYKTVHVTANVNEPVAKTIHWLSAN